MVERVARLFDRERLALHVQVRRWGVPPPLPVQAATGLVRAYRDLTTSLVLRLVADGRESAPAIAEHARTMLVGAHPALEGFSFNGRPPKAVVADAGALTVAVAALINELLWTAGDQGEGDGPGRDPARAHARAAAPLPVRRTLRPDVVEGGVSRVQAGTLYVVSTPIGNMGDFSFRAVETLRAVAAVLAEDTRHTRHLLDRYEIDVPLVAYHEHNEAKATPGLVARLLDGRELALVSDAGRRCSPIRARGSCVPRSRPACRSSPVPGASALLAALVASGLDVDRFTFFGFLPRKGTERRAALDEIVAATHVAVSVRGAEPGGRYAGRARRRRRG